MTCYMKKAPLWELNFTFCFKPRLCWQEIRDPPNDTKSAERHLSMRAALTGTRVFPDVTVSVIKGEKKKNLLVDWMGSIWWSALFLKRYDCFKSYFTCELMKKMMVWFFDPFFPIKSLDTKLLLSEITYFLLSVTKGWPSQYSHREPTC